MTKTNLNLNGTIHDCSFMFSTILAILAISTAAGIRMALPLLIISLIQNQQYWSKVPLLNQFPPQLVLTILISWSLFELLASKRLLGQRLLQLLQLFLSPLVGFC